ILKYKIIFEDDWVMVVDKPANILVIPTPKNEKNTLTNLLNRELDSRGIEVNAYPCHRIDRETSGIILYAKGKNIQKIMMDEFKKRNIKKSYLAVAHGIIKNDSGVIKGSIFNRNKNREEFAVTKYKVLERRGAFTVLEVEPVTGRTNQIRIHFKKIGHPLVGESVYAFRKDFDLKFKRVALHAKSLEFTHPVTKNRVSFTCPPAQDMEKFI
ncbi:MAG: RluA family pseudouridine synthase, partial [Candidatus Omnitrophica bacterium]|nr:RluA family pseudouridine synthase [Candidatus Omnitrophota bacterium]